MKRTTIWKRLLGGAMAVGMVLSLLPAGSMVAKAEGTVQIRAGGNYQGKANMWCSTGSIDYNQNGLNVEKTNSFDFTVQITSAYKINDTSGFIPTASLAADPQTAGPTVSKKSPDTVSADTKELVFTMDLSGLTDDTVVDITIPTDKLTAETFKATIKKGSGSADLSTSLETPSISNESALPFVFNDSIDAGDGRGFQVSFKTKSGYMIESLKVESAGSTDNYHAVYRDTLDYSLPGGRIFGNLDFTIKTAESTTITVNPIEKDPRASIRYSFETGTAGESSLAHTIPFFPKKRDNFTFTVVPSDAKQTVASVTYTNTDNSTAQPLANSRISGNTVTIPANLVDNLALTITLKNAGNVARVDGGGNIKSTKPSSSGNYYVSNSSASSREPIPSSNSQVMLTAGDSFDIYLYDHEDKAVSGKRIVYRFAGDSSDSFTTATNSSGKTSVSVSSGNTKDLVLYRVTDGVPVVVSTSNNLRASRSPGENRFYASTSSSSVSSSSRTVIPDSGSSVIAENGTAFHFYLYDNDGKAVANRTVTYRFSNDDSDRTLVSDSDGYCTTASVPNAATRLTLYSVTTGTVNATYAGYGATDNLATVTTSVSGSTRTLTTSATAVPRNTAFTFTVSPTNNTNGIRTGAQVSVSVGDRSVTPEVVSSGINGITYRIPASSVNGDIRISRFTGIDAKQTVRFNAVSNLTIAQRDDNASGMQPYSNGVLTLVKGDDAVVKLTPANGYTINNLAMTDGNDKAIANVTRNSTSGLTVIPAASVTDGMTVKSITTVALAPTATTTNFVDDANISTWAKADVKLLTDLGVIKGDNNGRFNPKQPASRADFATMLFRIRGTRSTATVSRFPDVTAAIGADYFEAILASENDRPAIINGFPDGNFYPSLAVTRGQGILMAYRAAGSPAYNGLAAFTDLEPWYATAASWGAANGIVNGVGGGRYEGGRSMTREELSAILVRAMRKNAFPRMNVTLP